MVNETARVRTPGTQRKKRNAAAAAEVRDPVEVMCRVRPLPQGQEDSCISVLNEQTLRLTPPEQSRAFLNSKDIEYTFKRIFDDAFSQTSLFRIVGLPLVDDLLRGRNGLLFTYGITGSGKTHTMTGTSTDGGLLPRCLDVLFNAIRDFQAKKYVFKPDKMNGFDVQSEVDAMLERQQRDLMAPKMKFSGAATSENLNAIGRLPDPTKIEDVVDEDNAYSVFVGYCEIYNNYVYDLLEEPVLDPRGQPRPPSSRKLREDAAKVMYVENLTEVEVKSTEEAYEALVKGDRNRRRAQTVLNHESSRSHSVFNIRLVQAPLDPSGEEILLDKSQVTVSQLSLVDLAGSERQDRTKAAGDRLKEAGQINNSLMSLRTCIETLRDNQQAASTSALKMVPYRDSRITHLFKNFFEGEGKVKMVVCVNPMAADYDETLHVMKFAEVTQEVKTARAAGLKNNLGLTPGRRRANACRKALDEAAGGSESGSGSVSDDSTPSIVYDLGPPLPMLSFDDPTDENFFPSLIQALLQRQQRRQTMNMDLQRRQDAFRSHLQDVETEITTLRGRVIELETALSARDKENARLRKRMQQMEASTSALKKNHAETVQQKKELESEVETKVQRIKQEKDARRRLQDEMASKMQVWEKHMSSKYQQELRKQAEKHEVEKRVQSERFMALKEIINSEDPQAMLYAVQVEPEEQASVGNAENIPPRVLTKTTSASATTNANNHHQTVASGSAASHVKNLVSNLEARGGSVSSSTDSVPSSGSTKRTQDNKASSSSTSLAGGGNRFQRVQAADRSTASKSQPTPSQVAQQRVPQRSKSPPPSASGYNASKPLDAKTASGVANRRRSRSTGNNVWLDHRPVPSADCTLNGSNDAILQPKISCGEKRVGRKSLTRIDAKDVEKATKYALTEQRVDSDGEVETKVFKGDVLPSRGGGSEVKLTDVEIHKMRQISPGSKRSYSLSREPKAPEEVEEVESRCNIAIEGHAQPKAKKNY